MTRLFDNIDEKLGDRLVETLEGSDRLDAAVGYFNLRGWSQLADHLDKGNADNGPVARILVGMTLDNEHRRLLDNLQAEVSGDEAEQEIDSTVARRRKDVALEHFRAQLMTGLPTERDRSALRRMRRHLAEGLLRVKLFTRRPMHAKTYICHREDFVTPIVGYVGSSNLTLAGLKHQYELNVDVIDSDATKKLDAWFNDRWDDRFSIDISSELIDVIEKSWASEEPVDPYLLYLKVCYLVSQEARDGLLEYALPPAMQKQLLDFQASAVQTLARRIVHRGGAMLGDVVGLGKTITAVAVAMLLRDERGYNPLIVCPKNLVKMWKKYLETYEIFGRVVSFSTAADELADLRRYQLVIVDESHTLRTNTRQDYQAIRAYIEDNDSKVLLLTATPYNTQYLDVANQLALYIGEDENLGISPVEALKLNPRIADQVDGKISTLAAFRRSEESSDWRRLMSEHLVRRTRSFIRENYAKRDDETGREFVTFADGSRFYFPDRLPKPLAHRYGETDPARLMADDSTLAVIDSLKLPRSCLPDYLLEGASPTAAEQKVLDDLQRAGGNLIGFTRSSFFKRLSSCGHSFVLSLQRHLARNQMYLAAIERNEPLPVGTVLESMISIDEARDRDLDDAGAADFDGAAQYDALRQRSPRGMRWLSAELFGPELAADLRADAAKIRGLLEAFGRVDQVEDSKIDALYELLEQRHPGEKVLIFSEYKDTVDYVATALQDRGVQDIAAVSGQTADPTVLAERFSPRSNERVLGKTEKKADRELRVLVTTDVLSEGQNLQDAHIVVNYDLPWAIIRLIQRAGRVDRVGQESPEVLVYSFLPDDSVEAVLDLRRRIRRRLKESAAVFGSDESFFGTDEEVSTIEGLYGGTMSDIDDGEVDATSFAYQEWNRAQENQPTLADRARRLPDLVSAAKAARKDGPTGVLVYARTERGFDAFAISPSSGEEELLTSLEALQLMACALDEAPEPLPADTFDRIASLARGPLRRPRLVAGQLRGVRRRVWNRIGNSTDVIAAGAEQAMDALYTLPLRSDSETKLKRALATHGNEDLAELVSLMHKEGQLVVAADDVNDPVHVVCSMGLI